MTVLEQLQRDGLLDGSLLKLFRNAQKQLILIIERADPDSPFRSYRAQQIRAIDSVLQHLGKRSSRWTEREISRLVKAGAKDAADMIRSFDEKQFAFSFSGVSESAIKVLTEEAALEFGNSLVFLRRNATKVLIDRKKLNDEIVQGIIQGSSVYRTQTQLINALKRQGVELMRTSNGRRMFMEPYTNLLVRTQSLRAYNTGAKMQMLGSGRRFAKIATLRPDLDGEDICNRFEREKYIDLTKPEEIPPYHPNCRHVPIPVSFAELKAERPDLYRSAQAHFRNSV